MSLLSFQKWLVVSVILLSLCNYRLYVQAWVVNEEDKIQHGLHRQVVFQIQMIPTTRFPLLQAPIHRIFTASTVPEVGDAEELTLLIVATMCCPKFLLLGVSFLGIKHLYKCSHFQEGTC